jgi:hypothetical protein
MQFKLMKMKSLTVLALSMLVSGTTLAQMPSAGSPGGMGAALTKLFGEIKGFTAKAKVRVLDKAQQETMNGPMDFALLDNKVRVELDMTRIKNKAMPEGAAAQMKQLGMAHVVSIIRPDKKLIYLIYPDGKAVTSMPLPKEDVEAGEKNTKLQKTPLGKETIDGHPCVKNKVVVTGDKGQILEAVTWNATDLKDFPVQIQTKEQDNTSIVLYSDIQLEKPDPTKFDPPPGFTEYSDQMQLMQELIKKGHAPPAKK